ncbi:hypothetical protein VII00023_01295 [Vibrio ichthyoenteri ATCC 700023]|uniref:DUF2780 domain-containing protein n=1 Tax=Vibrio ichthyoenteri ATCC 700023 TaxID=870968 RepID=F9RZX4_9VIBR|nr:DUF2780 domain-containing protein [Vibrio ichthyoenteri]EGU44169.1 hypothetical protein VII00023_01295 [Vibrio ichthyoenteri ATCC 700023]
MKKCAAALAVLLFTTTANASSFLDSATSKDATDLISNVSEKYETAGHSLPMTDLLTQKLNVSPEQALTGTNALFSLAENQLSSGDLSELESLIPWSSSIPDAQSLLGNVENMDAVKSVFEKAGLDPSMINQFVPVVLGYLGDSGASEGLLGSLGDLWNNAQ